MVCPCAWFTNTKATCHMILTLIIYHSSTQRTCVLYTSVMQQCILRRPVVLGRVRSRWAGRDLQVGQTSALPCTYTSACAHAHVRVHAHAHMARTHGTHTHAHTRTRTRTYPHPHAHMAWAHFVRPDRSVLRVTFPYSELPKGLQSTSSNW